MAAIMNRGMSAGPQGHRGGRGGFRGNRNNQGQNYDGDVDMSASSGSRGRNNQSRGNFQQQQQNHSPTGRNPFNDPNVQRETLRRAAQSTFQPRQNRNDNEQSRPAPRSSFQSSPAHPTNQPQRSQQNQQQQQPLRQAQVTGWRSSTASSDPDGGVKAVIGFIERRATKNKERHAENKGFRAGRPVRIHEHQVQGDILLIAFEQRDIAGIIHVDGNRFAGVDIAVKAVEEAAGASATSTTTPQTDNTIPQSVKDLPQEKIAMVAEVSRLTNLTPEYARMCLEQGNWDWQKAGELFDQAKNNGTLPSEAYLNGASQAQPQQPVGAPAPAPALATPATLTVEQKQQALVAEVSQLSGMTLQYSKLALEAADWDMEKASSKFMEIRETLPAEAWL